MIFSFLFFGSAVSGNKMAVLLGRHWFFGGFVFQGGGDARFRQGTSLECIQVHITCMYARGRFVADGPRVSWTPCCGALECGDVSC
jgi:hypothetical protein